MSNQKIITQLIIMFTTICVFDRCVASEMGSL